MSPNDRPADAGGASRVLVTGAAGFVGNPCCELLAGKTLVDRELEILALSRHDSAERQASENRPGIRWRQADLLDDRGLSEAKAAIRDFRPTHLLHLAWASGADGFRDSPENFRWLGPTLELLRTFHEAGGQRVVSVGTGAEYDWSDGVCSEDTPLRPSLTYGLCKSACSRLFERYCEQTFLSGAWARLFFLYGPGEESRRLVASMILALLRGEPARCNYDRLRRDYLFVQDAAEGLVRLLFSDVRGPINLASGEAPVLGDLVNAVAERIGRPELVHLGGLGEGEGGPAPLVVADIEKAESELGWQPGWRTDEALDHTIEYWRRELESGRLDRSENEA